MIILASNVFAQDTVYVAEDGGLEWGTINITFDTVDDDAWDGEITSDDTRWTIATVEWIDPPYSVAIEEFLELYEGYETECWNDSTFTYYGEFSVVGDSVVTNTWVHSDPTFRGFIQYLRKLDE